MIDPKVKNRAMRCGIFERHIADCEDCQAMQDKDGGAKPELCMSGTIMLNNFIRAIMNIKPYKQRCHVCDKLIVEGYYHSKWVELYDKPEGLKRSKLLRQIPTASYDRIMAMLVELREQHPAYPDHDLLTYLVWKGMDDE